jgi:prophage antirepressor-like protein
VLLKVLEYHEREQALMDLNDKWNYRFDLIVSQELVGYASWSSSPSEILHELVRSNNKEGRRLPAIPL